MADEKLLTTLRLGYESLDKDVAAINTILSKLGNSKGLDLSKALSTQMKSVTNTFTADIKKSLDALQTSVRKNGNAFKPLEDGAQRVLKIVETVNEDNDILTRTTSLDEQGRKVQEVTRNGDMQRVTTQSLGDFGKHIEEANKQYTQQHSILQQLYNARIKQAKADENSNEAEALKADITLLESSKAANDRRLAQLDQAAVAQSKANRLVDEEITLQRKLAIEEAKVADARAKAERTATAKSVSDSVKDVKENLSEALSEAKRASSKEGYLTDRQRSGWSGMAAAAREMLNEQERIVRQLDLEEDVRDRILGQIQSAKDLSEDQAAHVEKSNTAMQKLGVQAGQVGDEIVARGAQMVLDGLTQGWREAQEYAGTYYDLMNQIRIVSGKNEQEVGQLGSRYRQMAKEMKTTSTEIAEAAVEFWRQGLSESEVDERLMATVQYAKISDQDFTEAAELMTAATNTFGVEAQKVADVWALLGDESAAGADEIGKAMQKASASASEFGLSFEWLSAYIATISEQTREAPEVIGTSLNSLMGRLHSIKQNGYNEEDETRVNDVAKALNAVNIALFDGEGQWRDMNLIFDDVASKWDEMDDKQRSYISTTMAGTMQQNRFITLMSDMAKGLEGGSRAYALYESAMNSAGTAAEKYAIYQETVQAAQDGLTASLQELYSALLDGGMVRDFYNAMSAVVDSLTAGTQVMDGWNVKLPLIATGLAGVVAVVAKLGAVIAAIKTQGLITVMAGLSTGGLATAAAGAVVAVATITALVGAVSQAFTTSEEKLAALKDEINATDTKMALVDEVTELKAEYDALSQKVGKTNEDLARMNEIKSTMFSQVEQITGETSAYKDMEAAMGDVTKAYAEMLAYRRELAVKSIDESNKSYKALVNQADEYNWQIKLDEEALLPKPGQLKEYQEQQEEYKAEGQGTADDAYSGTVAKITEQQNEIDTLNISIEGNAKQVENLKQQMKDIFTSVPWDTLIQEYDEAGQEAALAFMDAFQFTEASLGSQTEFQTMLDAVGHDEDGVIAEAKTKQDDVLSAWIGGEGASQVSVQSATDGYMKAIGQVAGVTADALDATGTQVDAYNAKIMTLTETLNAYGVSSSAQQKLATMPFTYEEIGRMEAYIQDLTAIPELNISSVSAAIRRYIEAMASGNTEQLAQAEQELENLENTGEQIVETVVADTKQVEAAITQAQEKWKDVLAQRELEGAEQEGFKRYYENLEKALKGPDSLGAFQEAWSGIPELVRTAMMEADGDLAGFVSELSQVEEGGELAAKALEYLAAKIAEAADVDKRNLAALQEAEGGILDYDQYQRWQHAKGNNYGAQLSTIEGMQRSDNMTGLRAYLNGLRESTPQIYDDIMDLSDAMQALGTDGSQTAAQGLEILTGAMATATETAEDGKTAFEQMQEDIAQMAQDLALQEALGGDDEYASGALNYLKKQMEEAALAGEDLQERLGKVWSELGDDAKNTLVGGLGDFTEGLQEAAQQGEEALGDYVKKAQAAIGAGVFDSKGATYAQRLAAEQAQEDLYAAQIADLQRLASAAGDTRDQVIGYMVDMAVQSPEIFEGFVEMYPQALKLTQDGANAQEVLNGMYTQGLDTIRQQVAAKQEQLALDAKLEKSAEQMYKPALEVLRDAYSAGGAQGFVKAWEMLPEDQIEGLVTTYGSSQVGALDQIAQSGSYAAVALGQIDAILSASGPEVNMFSVVESSLQGLQDNLDTVQTALEKQSESGYLTYETYRSLIDANQAYADAIEYTGSALRLNAKEAAQIDKEQMDALKRQTQAASAEAMRRYVQDKEALAAERERLLQMEKMGSAQEEQTQQREKVNAAQTALNAQEEQVKNFRAMTAEIEGMTSAYAQYLRALNTPDQGAVFQQVGNMLAMLKGARESGKMYTDDVEAAAQYLMGSDVTLSADPERRARELAAMVKAVERYTADYKNIVKDLAGLDGVTLEGMQISFAEGMSLNDLAEKWGFSPEFVQDMLDSLGDYGYTMPTLEVEPPTIEWAGSMDDDAKNLMENLLGTKPHMGERGEGISQLQTYLDEMGYGDVMGAVDGIYGKRTTAALEQYREDSAAAVEAYKAMQDRMQEQAESYREGEEIDSAEIQDTIQQYNEIAQMLSELGIGELPALAKGEIATMDDLLGALMPTGDVDMEGASETSSEMLTFIEQYKELLSLMSTLDMESIAENMPSPEQLTQVMGKALEGLDTAEGVEQLNEATSALTGAIKDAIETGEADAEALDEAASKIQAALNGFMAAYQNIGGSLGEGEGGFDLQSAFSALEGWNPFKSLSDGALTASGRVTALSTGVNAVGEKEIGEMGADRAVTALQRVIDKLSDIERYRISPKTVTVNVKQSTSTPGFASGTDDASGGEAFVAEEGREQIYRKRAGVVEQANSMQMTRLEPGDRVIPHGETERILRRRDMTRYGSFAKGTKPNKKLKKELDKIESAMEGLAAQVTYYGAAEEYHSARNELDSVGYYVDKQQEVNQQEEEQLRKAIDLLLARMDQLETKQEKYKEGGKKWNKLQKQIDETGDSLLDYRTEQVQTITQQNALTEEIEKTQEQMREAQIDIRNEIEQAIQDREALNDRMLQGRISMEEAIMATLEANLEKEKEIAEEAADARVDAIQAEIDKIDELLEARRKLSDKEDKQAELESLEAQQARISADPTRAKERLELEKEIAELREEIAWDLAEEEAEAQKKALEEQIRNIEDYKSAVEGDDEEVDRADLVAQMEEILKGTDEEIIAWLKEHNQDYAEATKAAQTDMVNTWQDTLDDMNGVIRTHWDEVESIIAQGEDAIIAFLKANSSQYKEASQLQAEAYVEGWQETQAQAGISGAMGGQTGGDTGGSTATPSNPITETDPHLATLSEVGNFLEISDGVETMVGTPYGYKYKNKKGKWVDAGQSFDKQEAFDQAKSAAQAYWNEKDFPGSTGKARRKALSAATIDAPGKLLKAYSQGGLVDYTGLAMVHGTPGAPESFFSAQDTALLAQFRDALRQAGTIQAPTLAALGMAPNAVSPGAMVQTGDIIVQIEKVEDEQDMEELAGKVAQAIMDGTQRAKAPAWP